MILAFPMLNIYPLAFIAFVPMAIIIYSDIKIRKLVLAFFLYTYMFLGVIIFWIAAFMLKSTPLYIAIISLISVLAITSVYYITAAVVARFIVKQFPKIRWLVVPVCFAIAEYMRTLGFLGFPWGLIGYSQWKFLYFIQVADLFGVIGVGFIIYLINAIFADMVVKYRENKTQFYETYMKLPNCFTSNFIIVIVLFVLIISYGVYQINGRRYEYNIAMREVDIAMVQKAFDPNHSSSAIYTGEAALQGSTGFKQFIESLILDPTVFQNEEESDGKTRNSTILTMRIDALAREAAKEDPSMIVFCESAIRSSYQYYEPSIAENLTNMDSYKVTNPSFYNVYLMYDSIVSTGKYYLLGSYLMYPNTNTNSSAKYTYYNGANFINTNGSIMDSYGKMILVPFGEAYPFQDSKFFKETPPFSYLVSFIYKSLEAANVAGWGRWHDTIAFEHPDDDYKFGVPICYESAFGDFTRRFVNNGAEVIITITDDAWSYKDSSLWQHFSMGVFRAIENRRDFLQNGNSGITGHIDAFGHVLYTMDAWKPGYSIAKVKLNESTSIYTKHGEWLVKLLAIFLLALFLLAVILFFKAKAKDIYTFIKGQIIILKYKVNAKLDYIKSKYVKEKPDSDNEELEDDEGGNEEDVENDEENSITDTSEDTKNVKDIDNGKEVADNIKDTSEKQQSTDTNNL